VPKDKIRQRWTRSLKQLAWFAGHATSFLVFDNSDSDVTLPPPLIAHGTLGRLPELSEVAFPELRAAFTLPP
jgi:predicted ABC-type ATPase